MRSRRISKKLYENMSNNDLDDIFSPLYEMLYDGIQTNTSDYEIACANLQRNLILNYYDLNEEYTDEEIGASVRKWLDKANEEYERCNGETFEDLSFNY